MDSKMNLAQRLRQRAIPIVNLENLSAAMYQAVKDYTIIMVGEMHGTNEPAVFTYGLLKAILKKEGRAILALEIPSVLMNAIHETGIDRKSLLQTPFFQRPNTDGRNGNAWFELLLKCAALKGVIIKFIDEEDAESRDYSMYVQVQKIKQKYPAIKVITLTGNVHNWLVPFMGISTMGYLVRKDNQNFSNDRIMSINHLFNIGTMMNNQGKGLELVTLKGEDNLYNQTIPASMYFCQILSESENQYTHFLYTEQVTHSDLINY